MQKKNRIIHKLLKCFEENIKQRQSLHEIKNDYYEKIPKEIILEKTIEYRLKNKKKQK